VRHHGNFSLLSAVVALGKAFAECPTKALDKEVFADKFFDVYPLPSVALSKAFAEGKMASKACISSSASPS
jgi:hypothetical protein